MYQYAGLGGMVQTFPCNISGLRKCTFKDQIFKMLALQVSEHFLPVPLDREILRIICLRLMMYVSSCTT
jgi:hypothetical protein